MQENIGLIIIRNGDIHSPLPLGKKDLLLAGGKIVAIADHIEPPHGLDVTVIDARDRFVVPGLIDLHVHILGGGGEDGPASRVPEIQLSALTRAGTTTVVGVLGTDGITRSPEALLAKARALYEEGINAYIYTGSYHLPSMTITGNVERDLALIDQVVGVKLAVSDHRGSQPTTEELARLAAQVRVGAMLGGKRGIVHLHVGSGRKGISQILDVLDNTELPIDLFLPTHMARTPGLLTQGIEFVRRGGNIDITAHPSEEETVAVIAKLRAEGVDLSHVTLSSDGNGSMPVFNEKAELVGMKTGSVTTLLKSIRSIVSANVMPLSEALALVTVNPATRLGVSNNKGQVVPGADADLVVLDDEFRVDKVISRGRLLVDRGAPIVKGEFEAQ